MGNTNLSESIQNWLQGDEKEFSTLFYHYYPRLLQFSSRFISHRSQAEELVMNVLFKIWKARLQIGGVPTFNTYLYRAMRNEIISSFRRKRSDALAASAPLSLENTPAEPLVNPEYDYNVLLEEYASCIQKLPPKRRQIFLMSHQQGMTYPQIAATLNISLHTVQKQAGAAIRTIYKELGLAPGSESVPPEFIFLAFICFLQAPVLS